MPYNLNVRGWMSEQELRTIEGWTLELPQNAVIVEVGSYYGRTACCFAATAPTATVHCFDRWSGFVEPADPTVFSIKDRLANGFPLAGDTNSLENFLNNTREYTNIRAWQVHSPADIQWPQEESVDLFFLDAGHTNPDDWEYIEFWLPRIKRGGIISGHDLYSDRRMPAVNDNVERLEQLLGKPAQTYNRSSLWRIQK